LAHAQWVIKEIREEIKKFLKFNENQNNLSEPMGHNKGVLRGIIVMNAYIENTERSQTNPVSEKPTKTRAT
jgi:hypothetical protein